MFVLNNRDRATGIYQEGDFFPEKKNSLCCWRCGIGRRGLSREVNEWKNAFWIYGVVFKKWRLELCTLDFSNVKLELQQINFPRYHCLKKIDRKQWQTKFALVVPMPNVKKSQMMKKIYFVVGVVVLDVGAFLVKVNERKNAFWIYLVVFKKRRLELWSLAA